MLKKYPLMLTAAIALAGVIHKAKTLVDVDEPTAKNLLGRGKARLATAEELAAAGREAPADTDTDADAEAQAKAEAEAKAKAGAEAKTAGGAKAKAGAKSAK